MNNFSCIYSYTAKNNKGVNGIIGIRVVTRGQTLVRLIWTAKQSKHGSTSEVPICRDPENLGKTLRIINLSHFAEKFSGGTFGVLKNLILH